MGRSPRNPADSIDADESAPEETGVWQAVRRALGRLAARAVVREWEIGLPSLSVRHSSAPDFGEPSVDRPENDWRLGAQVRLVPLPESRPGGDGVNLAALVPVVRADAALSEYAPPVRSALLESAQNQTQAWSPEEWRVPGSVVASPVLTLSGGAARALPVAVLRAPVVGALSVIGPPLPPARSALDVCTRIPWERARLSAPPGVPSEDAFEPARARLAAAAQVPLDDVLLTGVFPRIPISAIRSLALGEGGAVLQFWFKPEALGGPPPRRVTLLLGRLRSTGALIRAVL